MATVSNSGSYQLNTGYYAIDYYWYYSITATRNSNGSVDVTLALKWGTPAGNGDRANWLLQGNVLGGYSGGGKQTKYDYGPHYVTSDTGYETVKNFGWTLTNVPGNVTSIQFNWWVDIEAAEGTYGTGQVNISVEIDTLSYTVGYVANGGSSTPSSQTKYWNVGLTLASAISRSNAVTTYTTSFNSNGGVPTASALTSTKTVTYSFAGWKASDGTIYSTATTMTYSTNAATTMTAQWSSTTKYSSITLPTLGSSETQASIPIYFDYGYNNMGTYATSSSEKTSTQTFGGWNTNSSGTGTNYSGGASLTPTSNTTLYAKWGTASHSYTNVDIPAAPSRDTYEFQGWKATNGVVYVSGNIPKEDIPNLVSSGSITLTATWKLNTFEVTLEKNDRTSSPSIINATYNSTIPNVPIPAYDGHTFLGYYDAQSGGNQYIDATGTGVKKWAQMSDGTLWAHWANVASVDPAMSDIEATLTTINFTIKSPAYTDSNLTCTLGGAFSGGTILSSSYDSVKREITYSVQISELTKNSSYTGTVTLTLQVPSQSKTNRFIVSTKDSPRPSITCGTNLSTLTLNSVIEYSGLTTNYYINNQNSVDGAILLYSGTEDSGEFSKPFAISDLPSGSRGRLYNWTTNPTNTLYVIAVATYNNETYTNLSTFTVTYSDTNTVNIADLKPVISSVLNITDAGELNYVYNDETCHWDKLGAGVTKPKISSLSATLVNDNYYFLTGYYNTTTEQPVAHSVLQFKCSNSTMYSASAVVYVMCGSGWQACTFSTGSTDIYTYTFLPADAVPALSEFKFKIIDSRGISSEEYLIAGSQIMIQAYSVPTITASVRHNWGTLSQLLLIKLEGTFTKLNSTDTTNDTEHAEPVYKPQVKHTNNSDFVKNNTITEITIKKDGEVVSTLTTSTENPQSGYSVTSKIESLNGTYKIAIDTGGTLIDEDQDSNAGAHTITITVADRFESTTKSLFIPTSTPVFNKGLGMVSSELKDRFGFNTKTLEGTFTYKTDTTDTYGFVVDDVDMRVNNTFVILTSKPSDWDVDCRKYYSYNSATEEYSAVALGTTFVANTYYENNLRYIEGF